MDFDAPITEPAAEAAETMQRIERREGGDPCPDATGRCKTTPTGDMLDLTSGFHKRGIMPHVFSHPWHARTARASAV